MDRETWLTSNRAAIMARLQWLQAEPDGLLFVKQSGAQLVIVDKVESTIRLWLGNPLPKLVQSQLNLSDPLHLVSPYSQAALLGLVWQNRPQRIYLAGLGGGCLALALHHYLPETVIEAIEIDPVVIEAARRFFGLQPDARLMIANQDGRAYLAQNEAGLVYDWIFNDAFSSETGPIHLATQGFYRLCQSCLAEGGVVIVNLLRNDPGYTDKIKTIQSVFPQTYLWPFGWGNALVIGSNGRLLEPSELIERARLLQAEYQFPFSLVDRALELKSGPALSEYLPDLGRAAILVDEPEID